jgi:RNA polymerase sigma factor (TIGR02999 family)
MNNNVTEILQQAGEGDPAAGEKLLPLIYEELRQLAASRMANERVDHTLQATALVHEAYIRLVGKGDDESTSQKQWDGRGHFFAAAAEAMRRILIESARRKMTERRGADFVRKTWDDSKFAAAVDPDEILAVDEALTRFAAAEPELAKLVSLRYFAGMTIPETAAALGISARSVNRQWGLARAWLYREISKGQTT